MENKINIAELLKDCPKGMELDCTMFENLEFDHIDKNNELYPIICRGKYSNGEHIHVFTKYGCYNAFFDYSKCVIFPKGKTTWEGFHRPFKDGDVVVTTFGNIAIISNKIDNKSYSTYCKLFKNGTFTINDSCACPWRLATEEEKEELFKAIKANGYRWNLETKTLEKLPKFKVGDRIILKDNPHNIPSIKIKAVTKSQYILENAGFFYIDSADEKYVLENKFDITTLKPFDRVLVRLTNNCVWMPKFFSRYDSEMKCYSFIITDNVGYPQCIPYEGNKHLAGKTDDCDEFYKTWE